MSTMLFECGACGIWKVAADFYRDVRFPDRWVPRSSCKVCYRVKRKAPHVHWLAKVCSGCQRMVPLSGYYMSRGAPMMPCKVCRSAYRPPAAEPVDAKRCSKCKQTKPAASFTEDQRKSTRLSSQCVDCQRAYRPATIVRPAQKRCSMCKAVRPANDFYETDRTPSGLYTSCKTCHNRRAYPGQKRYRASHKELYSAANHRKWAKWTPERKAAQLVKLKAHNAANPDMHTVRIQRRRVRLLNTVNDFTIEQWRAMKAAYGFRCAYCDKKTKRLTMDHVVPLAKGGQHTARNIVPACRPCNVKKNTKPAPTHQTHFIQ